MDYNCAEAEEIIEQLLLDNSMEERRLKLLNQLYGEGSSFTQKRVKNRDRESAHDRLVKDYFAKNSQKCTAAMRMLAYEISADVVDDYVRIDESTEIECLKRFVTNVILIFESEYLRKPNSNDVQRLLKMGEDNGFLAWKGMFMSGHKGVQTILLEAVASSDLWIWHAFFGVVGSNNDINVLDRSSVIDEVLEGRAP
ncbi:uncharacterized protein LOC141686067 [Apium graveolens]|uniref:uncharacterized protein LOC141686067 n=1 Tax=Apium graveolens TaxID=4045 RepID=UPI003D7A8DF2